MKKRIIKIVLYMLTAFAFFCISVYCMFFWNWKEKKRQSYEEQLAGEWINYIISYPETVENGERVEVTEEKVTSPEIESEIMEDNSGQVIYQYYIKDDFSYLDDYYFSRGNIIYTPDYAKGVFSGVIYYEKCGLAREVFTARNNDEANANLDMWIPTIVNPRALVGWSAFCIKLHNHTQKKISGNELGNAEIGDKLYFLTTEFIYTYMVTDIYRMSRDLVEATLDNDPWGYPDNKMFLATCGRDEKFMVYKEKTLPEGVSYLSPADIISVPFDEPTTSRYMDFIVESELVEISNIKDNEYAQSLVNKIKKKAKEDSKF